MTISSWPFEGVDTTETQYSRLLRHIGQGVNGTPGDNNLLTYADSTGMQVKVKVAGGNSQAIVRGHMFQSTAEETLVIDSSEANPRIDSVVLTLDPTANSIVLGVVKGTASVSPTAPTLTQTDTSVYQLKLADVLVAGGATTISAGDVTDRRQFLNNVWTTVNRPVPFVGLTGYNVTVQKLETYNGTGWVEVTPTALDASVITTGTFNAARIPSLDASKTGSGTFDVARIPSLDASKTGSGTFDVARIPGLSTDKLTSGILPLARGGVGADTQAGARSNIGAAATVHTHTISQVTDLQTSLDGKAAVSHTHTISQVTGLQSALDGKQVAGSYAAASHTHNGLYGTGGAQFVWNGSSAFAGNVSISMQGDIGCAGELFAGTRLKSPGTYNQTNSGRAVFVSSDGIMGIGSSSERFKENIEEAQLDLDAIRQLSVKTFTYKKDFTDDNSPQIGVIAEDLVSLGLTEFVYFDDEGNADGVAYEKLSLALIPLVQETADRLDAIEARIEALEK
jgi:hypothetical protein